jgi:ArsR family transcriptional regulator, arsenate/arsenite/antimonite-responsive transcriptional repressor
MRGKKKEGARRELLFRALADGTRLRLLNLMGDDEVCVCYLVEALGMSQSKISRHLAYLRRAGIVAARRDGKWMHYRLFPPRDRYAAGLLAAARVWLANDPEMRSDRSRLVRLCCSSTVPAPLKRAPKPAGIVSPKSRRERPGRAGLVDVFSQGTRA